MIQQEREPWSVHYGAGRAHPKADGVFLSVLETVVSWPECQEIASRPLLDIDSDESEREQVRKTDENVLVQLARTAIRTHEVEESHEAVLVS